MWNYDGFPKKTRQGANYKKPNFFRTCYFFFKQCRWPTIDELILTQKRYRRRPQKMVHETYRWFHRIFLVGFKIWGWNFRPLILFQISKNFITYILHFAVGHWYVKAGFCYYFMTTTTAFEEFLQFVFSFFDKSWRIWSKFVKKKW